MCVYLSKTLRDGNMWASTNLFVQYFSGWTNPKASRNPSSGANRGEDQFRHAIFWMHRDTVGTGSQSVDHAARHEIHKVCIFSCKFTIERPRYFWHIIGLRAAFFALLSSPRRSSSNSLDSLHRRYQLLNAQGSCSGDGGQARISFGTHHSEVQKLTKVSLVLWQEKRKQSLTLQIALYATRCNRFWKNNSSSLNSPANQDLSGLFT